MMQEVERADRCGRVGVSHGRNAAVARKSFRIYLQTHQDGRVFTGALPARTLPKAHGATEAGALAKPAAGEPEGRKP